MQKSAAIFFLSETYKKNILENYVPADLKCAIQKKINVIPNGIDDFWIKNVFKNKRHFSREPKSIKIIYVGKIDKNKNITTTQRAVDLLIKNGYDVQLSVIGPIVDFDIYKQVKKHKYTTVYSELYKEELIQKYRENDIFVMPSIKETFGLVYAEAISQGLPVIYTKGQGFESQFDEGVVGYSVSSNNPEEIAMKILKIIDNYGLITNNCINSIEKFSWDKIIQKYIEVYSDILGPNLYSNELKG